MSGPGEATPERVDEVLAALPEREQVAQVEAWIKAGDGARVAAAAAGARVHKNARKAAKKGIYVLRARGVAAPEVARAPEATPAAAAASGGRGYMTKVDPMGVQILLHVHPARGGGLVGAQVIAQRGVGVVEGGGIEIGRKELRQHLDRLAADGISLHETPVEHVRARIARLLDRTREASRPVPDSVLSVEIHLPPAAPPARHPIDDRLPDRPAGRLAEADMAALERAPMVEAWGPEERTIHALLERLDAAGGGGLLVLTPAQKADAAADVLGKTIEETFADRGPWAEDLRDTAYCLLDEGDRATAELLARSADELDDAARAPREVAFVRWLYRHALARHAEHHGHAASEDESAPEPRRSPGGIILP